MNRLPQRKSIRLDEACYEVSGAVFEATIVTEPRRNIFDDVDLGLDCVQILQDLKDKKGNPVYAYCLMPDHAHLLVGVSKSTSFLSFVGAWKSLAYHARRRRGDREKFWQRSFHDRAIRRDDDLLIVARYILNNPVRAGLVEDYRDYPLTGSMGFEL